MATSSEITSMTPIRKKITEKISMSPGFLSKTVTETTRFNEGTLRRSFHISQIWSPNTKNQHRSSVTSNPSASSSSKPKMILGSQSEEISNATTRRRIPWLLIFGAAGIALLPNLIPLFLPKQNSIWPLQNVTHVLESSVFGQSAGIRSLTYAFNELFLNNESGVIFLTGSVGVGKTLASSLIQREYPWKGNLYSEFADSLAYKDFPRPLFKNLLIIEDCNERNRQKALDSIRSFLSNAKATGHQLIILSIFTHKTDHELTSFLDSASRILDYYYHVPFQSLGREAVKKCIEKFIDVSQLEVHPSAVEKLVEKQMEVGEGNVSPGCKQIDALIIKYKSIVRRPFDDDDDELVI